MLRAINIVFLFLFPFYSFANTGDGKEVKLNIKSITASEQRELNRSERIEVAPELKALRKKLRKIPYRKFMLDMAQDVTVEAGKEQVVPFANGDTLTIKLLYRDEERLGVMILWKSKEDEQLLDTRMHFSCSETMIAGAEKDQDSGQILAITVANSDPSAEPPSVNSIDQ